jgi:hypothetical protein
MMHLCLEMLQDFKDTQPLRRYSTYQNLSFVPSLWCRCSKGKHGKECLQYHNSIYRLAGSLEYRNLLQAI